MTLADYIRPGPTLDEAAKIAFLERSATWPILKPTTRPVIRAPIEPVEIIRSTREAEILGTAAPIQQDTGIISNLVDWYREADKKATAKIADTFNVTTKTVETVSLIGLIGTGAGLLANGVKSLFDGTLKEKRAIKKAERADKKATKQGAALAAAYATMPGQGQVAGGGVTPMAPGAGASLAGAEDFLKKNWIILALVALVLFGGKLFKPKRRAPRRRAPAKVVTRYRTRKPAVRRRKR